MIRHLQRRLDRLEEAVPPIEEETLKINVYYTSPDGPEKFGYALELPRHRDWKDSRARKTKEWR